MKTHYVENGKSICGTITHASQEVKTTTAWYAAVNKCKKCQKEIKIRTLQQW